LIPPRRNEAEHGRNDSDPTAFLVSFVLVGNPGLLNLSAVYSLFSPNRVNAQIHDGGHKNFTLLLRVKNRKGKPSKKTTPLIWTDRRPCARAIKNASHTRLKFVKEGKA
jgi:hypothetical protein